MQSTWSAIVWFGIGALVGGWLMSVANSNAKRNEDAPERRSVADVEVSGEPDPAAPTTNGEHTTSGARAGAELRRLRARVAELEAARDEPEPSPTIAKGVTTQTFSEEQTVAEILELGMLLRATGKPGARPLWNDLAQRLAADPDGTLPDLLAWLAPPLDINRAVAIRDLLNRRDLELDDETVAQLRATLVDGLLAAEDLELQSTAISALQTLLRRQKPDGERFPAAERAELVDLLASSDDRKLRQETLQLLGEHARGSLEVVTSFDRIARADPDPVIRARALAQLRGQDEATAQRLVLDVLAHEIEPVVLWEAAKPANFLTLSSGSIRELKGSYRDLLHREVDDRARAQAAQSLALIATLDGDGDVPAELRHLASTTSDPALAEFARTAAQQLADGSATIVSIAEAWRPWHEQQDREQFP